MRRAGGPRAKRQHPDAAAEHKRAPGGGLPTRQAVGITFRSIAATTSSSYGDAYTGGESDAYLVGCNAYTDASGTLELDLESDQTGPDEGGSSVRGKSTATTQRHSFG